MMNSRLLGLHCILLLWTVKSLSCSPVNVTSKSGTGINSNPNQNHNEESDTEINNQVPNSATTNSAQNHARSILTGVVTSKLHSGKKNISKRSTMISGLPDEYQYFSKRHPKSDCEDDENLCSKEILGGEVWDNQEYGGLQHSNEDSDLPDAYYNNKNIHPYSHIIQSNNMYEYPKKVSDTEHKSQIPRIVVVALPKSSVELSGHPQEYSEEELLPIQESKRNIFSSRGWGAGGMPFSVLYMHPNQYLKPVSRSPVVGAQQLVAPPQAQALHGLPPANQYRQVAVRNAISSALTASNNRGGGGSGTPLPTRRQYSIIPQLYISYGWGPHGK